MTIDRIDWTEEGSIMSEDSNGFVRMYSAFQRNSLNARVTLDDGSVVLVVLPKGSNSLPISRIDWWDLIEMELNRHVFEGQVNTLVLTGVPDAEPV